MVEVLWKGGLRKTSWRIHFHSHSFSSLVLRGVLASYTSISNHYHHLRRNSFLAITTPSTLYAIHHHSTPTFDSKPIHLAACFMSISIFCTVLSSHPQLVLSFFFLYLHFISRYRYISVYACMVFLKFSFRLFVPALLPYTVLLLFSYPFFLSFFVIGHPRFLLLLLSVYSSSLPLLPHCVIE